MECTVKEQETCDVEKRGCDGCAYNVGNKSVGNIKKKTVVEHLDSLIEFYSNIETSDERLKKLIVRNLKDVKRRAEKEQ